jgi:hypothetical protein
LLHDSHIFQLGSNTVQQIASNLRVRDFASSEADPHPHLHPILKPLARIAHLERAVMTGGFGSQPDFLDLDLLLLLSRFPFALGLFVLELAKVHDPANGRLSIRRNLDQIQSSVIRKPKRLSGRHNAFVVAFVVDQANLARSDCGIDSIL